MKLQTESATTNSFTKNPAIYFYVVALILMLFLSWQYERMHAKDGKPNREKAETAKF